MVGGQTSNYSYGCNKDGSYCHGDCHAKNGECNNKDHIDIGDKCVSRYCKPGLFTKKGTLPVFHEIFGCLVVVGDGEWYCAEKSDKTFSDVWGVKFCCNKNEWDNLCPDPRQRPDFKNGDAVCVCKKYKYNKKGNKICVDPGDYYKCQYSIQLLIY